MDPCLSNTLVILGWKFVPPAPRGMRMTVARVVVPDRGDVARVGLEEEFWHRVDAAAWLVADGAVCGGVRVGHRALEFKPGFAFRAGIIVLRHSDLNCARGYFGSAGAAGG
jgi:hypothetical protein